MKDYIFVTIDKGSEIKMKKTFDAEKYGMTLCPLCKGKGFIIASKRQCCQECGGFGYIKKESQVEKLVI